MKSSTGDANSVTLLSLLCILLLFGAPGTALGSDLNLSLGLGFEFATGNYGSGSSTESFSIPLTIRYEPTERFDLELIVPYLYQSDGSTTATGTFRFKNGRTRSGASSSGNGHSGTGSSDDSHSESGPGDLTLKAGYILWPEGGAMPRVRPLLYLQFPTGDEDKGLGTGEFSVGTGLELEKWFGNWLASVEGIYNFQGHSSDFRLKDYFSYEAGVGYQLTDRFRPTLLLRGATAPSEYSSTLAELRVKALYRLTGRASLEGYLGAGLTSQSPDFVVGVALFYDF